MTIRTRLTVWYTGALLSSFLLMAAVLFYELVFERQWATAEGKSNDPIEEEIGEIILLYGVPTIIFTVVGGWWLLRKALAPLDQLATAAEMIQINNLRQKLPRSGNGDEIDRLSDVLNATNQRLEESFSQIQEFTLHASHELKTPLAIMHGEIEMALSSSNCNNAQREIFESQLTEIQRLTKIVDGLTLLAKAGAGKVALDFNPVTLDELVRDCVDDARILAQNKNIKIILKECDPVMVMGDQHRIRQLLLNLTENAIKYNTPHGQVDFALHRKERVAELSITNTGPGIAPEHLSRVFIPFFRGNLSHDSETEGCGLGLSIAQWIVKAHFGEIEISSVPGQWTKVTVTLPLLSQLPS